MRFISGKTAERLLFPSAMLLAVVLIFTAVSEGQISIPTIPGIPDLNVFVSASGTDTEEDDFVVGAAAARGLTCFPTVGGVFTLESDSALDGVGGTGTREVFVEVIYQHTATLYETVSETVVMNGLTPVIAFDLGGLGVRRLRRMSGGLVGNQEINQPIGNIVADVGGVPISEIISGNGRAEIAVWTSGPPGSPEQINTVEIGFVGSQGGLDWEVTSIIRFRQFALGHGWINSVPIQAREPQTRASVVLNTPVPLPPLTDFEYRILTIEGSDVSITFSSQVTKVSSAR